MLEVGLRIVSRPYGGNDRSPKTVWETGMNRWFSGQKLILVGAKRSWGFTHGLARVENKRTRVGSFLLLNVGGARRRVLHDSSYMIERHHE